MSTKIMWVIKNIETQQYLKIISRRVALGQFEETVSWVDCAADAWRTNKEMGIILTIEKYKLDALPLLGVAVSVTVKELLNE